MTLLTGIVLFFLGGWLKKNKRPRKMYLSFFAVGSFFLVLSLALSIGGIVGYVFPINPIFAAAAAAVLFVEAIFVWRLSIRGGRKALV